MATIKSYTDINQSKKLAEILPIISADMFYIAGKGEPIFIGNKMVTYGEDDYDCFGGPDVLCWSLAALLDVLPYPHIEQNYKWKWTCRVELGNTTYLWEDSNPVDACYEMILKLHKLKML